jgi:hypothetical protein
VWRFCAFELQSIKLLDSNQVNLIERTHTRLKGLVVKRPGMVFGLWGEAGIGKTHAVQKLLHENPSRHLSIHATTSLAKLVKALPKPKKLPVWAEPMLEKLERNGYLSTEQSTSVLGVVMSGIAPFILHLEDVHDTSAEQIEWIVALAKVVTRLKGVALIVTSRLKQFDSKRLMLKP